MSKIFKRIGTKAYKFHIDVLIQKVTLSLAFPCQVSVLWIRGAHKNETPKYDLDTIRGQANINEQMTLNATLYQNSKTLKYQEKKSAFRVVITTPKGTKTAGECELDLAEYINNEIKEKNEMITLKKCPDKNAKIYFYIKIALLREILEGEREIEGESIMSDQTARINDISSLSELQSINNGIESSRIECLSILMANNNSNLQQINYNYQDYKTEILSPSHNDALSITLNLESTNNERLANNIANIKTDESHTDINDHDIILRQKSEESDNYNGQILPTNLQNASISKHSNSFIESSSFQSPINRYNTNNTLQTNDKRKVTFNDLFSKPSDIDTLKTNTRNVETSNNLNVLNSGMSPRVLPTLTQNQQTLNIEKPNSTLPLKELTNVSNINPTSASNIVYIPVEKKVYQYAGLSNNTPKATVNIQDDKVKMNKLQEELGKKNEEVSALKNSLKNLQKENTVLQANNSALEIANLRDEISALNTEFNKKVSELSLKNDEIATLRREIDTQKQAIFQLANNKGQEFQSYIIEIEKLKQNLRGYEIKNKESQEELTQLQFNCRKLESEYQNTNLTYQQLKTEHQSTISMYNNLKNEKDEIINTNQIMSMELKKHKELNQNLEKEIEKLRLEITNLANENDNIRKIEQAKNTKIYEDLKREYMAEKKAWEESYALNEKGMRDAYIKAQNQAMDLRNQLKDAENKKEEILSRYKQLMSEYQSLKLSYDKANADIKLQNESLADRLKGNEESIKNLEIENGNLRQKISMVLTAAKENEMKNMNIILNLKEELKLKEDKLNISELELINKLNGKEEEMNQILYNKNEEYAKEKRQYDNQIRLLHKTIEFKNVKIEELENNINQLNEEYDILNKNYHEKLQSDQQEQQKREERYMNHLEQEDLKQQNQRYQQDILDNQHEIKKLQNEIYSLRNENNKMRGSVRANRQEQNEFKKDLEENYELKKEIQGNIEQIDDLKNQLEEANINIKTLRDEIKTLKAMKNNINSEFDKDDNNNYLKRIEKDQNKIKSLQEELDHTQNQLIKCKIQLASIMNILNEECKSSFLQRIHKAMGIIEY